MDFNAQRVLFMGMQDPDRRFRIGQFFDQTNINEFSLICWDAQTLNHSLLRPTPNKLQAREYTQFVSEYTSRWEKISRWVTNGHVLLIFNFDVLNVSYVTDDKQQVRGALNELPPFNEIQLSPSTGQLVAASSKFSTDFDSFCSLLSYHFTISGKNTIPLFITSTTRVEEARVVGAVVGHGKGAIVFSPPLSTLSGPAILQYFASIVRVPQIIASATTVSVPSWADAFRSKREQTASEKIQEIDREVANLERQKAEATTIREEENNLKALYTGYDRNLVVAVQQALSEIGLSVIDGPHPRADLLIWDGGIRLAAAEVKGLLGTAREFNLSQTQRWVSDVRAALQAAEEERRDHPELAQYTQKLSELGIHPSAFANVDCHGLMIIGTFRDTRLDERPSENYPHQLRGLIARARFSALTGLDLYCMLQEARAEPSLKSVIIDQLFSEDGVLPTKAWRDTIHGDG